MLRGVWQAVAALSTLAVLLPLSSRPSFGTPLSALSFLRHG